MFYELIRCCIKVKIESLTTECVNKVIIEIVE